MNVCVCVLNVCLCECMSTLSDIMYRRETESCMYGGSSCMSHNTVVTSSPLLLLLSAILPLWLPFIYQCLFTSFSLLSAVHPCCPWPSLFLLVIYLSLFTCSHPRITRCTLPTSIDLTFFFFSPPLSSLTFPDGVHSISAPCVLRVLIITEDMLGSSVTVRLQNMSQEHFLSPLLGNFLEGVSAVLSVPVEDVFIFNIQPDLDAAPGGILNVSFSAALPGGLFFPSEALEEQLYLNRLRLTSLTQMEVRSHLQLWIHIPNTYCSALWNPRPTQEQKYYGIFTSSDHSATCLHSWTHVQQLAIRGPCNRTCRAKVIRHIVQTHMHLKRCSPEHIAHELMIQHRCHASAAIWDHRSNTPIWALSCMKSHTPGHSKHISNTHALHN